MVNNVSFNQILSENQKTYSSSAVSGLSFDSYMSSALYGSSSSDTIADGLDAGLVSNQSGITEMILSLLKNGNSSGMVSLFLAMLGLGSGSGYSSTGYSFDVSEVLNKISNGNFAGGTSYNPKEGMGYIPSAASVASNPSITSNAYNRSAQQYRNVISQFNVENNPRYEVNKKGRGDTYCNIFVWDVTSAMGAEIPHYVNPDTLEPMYYPNTEGAIELTANGTYKWLEEKGAQYGWQEVSAETAQMLANQGRPVVTAKRNLSGRGHVQMVCPSNDGLYDPRRGVTVAQAGSTLTEYSAMAELYRGSMPQFKYYAHI